MAGEVPGTLWEAIGQMTGEPPKKKEEGKEVATVPAPGKGSGAS